jgi:8-oxo-dGTP pyrophosphatase MutT (NUDIX family)
MDPMKKPATITVPSPKFGPQTTVYQDPYQRIYKVTADFGEFTKEYFVRVSGPRAGVLVLCDDSVLLTRQYRLQIDKLSWEIPGGKVEEGESGEDAAIRECLEETGVQCEDLKPLLDYLPGLDISENPTSIFYSLEQKRVSQPEPNPREVLAQEWVPFDRCMEMIASQEITDALTILALMSFQLQVRPS